MQRTQPLAAPASQQDPSLYFSRTGTHAAVPPITFSSLCAETTPTLMQTRPPRPGGCRPQVVPLPWQHLPPSPLTLQAPLTVHMRLSIISAVDGVDYSHPCMPFSQLPSAVLDVCLCYWRFPSYTFSDTWFSSPSGPRANSAFGSPPVDLYYGVLPQHACTCSPHAGFAHAHPAQARPLAPPPLSSPLAPPLTSIPPASPLKLPKHPQLQSLVCASHVPSSWSPLVLIPRPPPYHQQLAQRPLHQ